MIAGAAVLEPVELAEPEAGGGAVANSDLLLANIAFAIAAALSAFL